MRARNARLFGVAALIEGAPDPRSPIPDHRAIQRFGSGNAIKGGCHNHHEQSLGTPGQECYCFRFTTTINQ